MKSFYWILALFFFIFTLQNEAEAEADATMPVVAAEAKLVMDTIQEGIKTTDRALNLYDRVIDRVIPWKEFNETLVELDKLRKDFSNESAELIGDIKTFMMNGIDTYFTAAQNAYEWAGVVVPLLTAYNKLFDKHTAEKAEVQKKRIVQVLDEGIERMTAAQYELSKSSSSFNSAAGKLTRLYSRLEVELDEESEYFQPKMTQIRLQGYASGASFGVIGLGLVSKAFQEIDNTKNTLRTEIQHIEELKYQTKTISTLINFDEVPDLRDMIIKSIQDLIAKCEAYRKRHINKTDLI